MQSLTRQLALEHAYAEAPKEACGLVVVHESIEIFYKCSNISETPEETFVLNPDHYAAAEDLGEITAVFHSHPKTPPTPSPLDKMGIEETQLPWVIVSLIDAEKPNWHTATPTNWKAPLVGRPYCWGLSDCWVLARDWYKKHRIILPEFKQHRPRTPKEFRQNPVFESLTSSAGFYEINKSPENLQKGDFLLLSFGSPYLNHCAVYSGDSRILHQPYKRLSSCDIYSTELQNVTGKAYRHYNWNS